MIKQLLINGAVNRYALSNRARQAIAFQYITDTRTLRLIDTYNNVAVDLVANGDNALTSSAIQKIWEYIQNRIDNKVGGSFKFRGTVDSLDDVLSPKAGDVYQVKVETHQTDPETGQIIPSSVQYNDKEFAWAEKIDQNTGLPIGGQWVELGFNFSGQSLGGVTEQWVKNYFVGQWQQEEVLSGIIAHTQLSTTLQTREQSIEEFNTITGIIDTTKQQLITYVDNQSSSSQETIQTVSATLLNYINNTVSTSIIYYVNEKISELSGAIDNLDTILNEKIDTMSSYFETQDGIISGALDNLHDYMIDRMDNISGGFITRDQTEDMIEDVINKHNTDMSFVQYDDEGNVITP